MGSASSGDAIRSITDWAATPRSSSSLGSRKPTEDFGSLTFNEEVQRAPHYLHGHRRETLDMVAAWLEARE